MKKVGLFFGGPSNEHEVSIESAKNIIANFPVRKYRLALVYWDKNGAFFLVKNINKLKTGKKRINLEDFKRVFDVALPITHGKYGEDGVLQSLLESHQIKYCGCRALSSALCMDKGLFKQYLSGQKINQVKFIVLDYNLDSQSEIVLKIAKIKSNFKFPIFIKPANSGSSVGITKVEKNSQITSAIKEALKFDSKVIVEEGLVSPKEIEVAVLGNKKLDISCPGELRLAKDFYSYEDKYKLDQTQMIIPANITKTQSREILTLAQKAYRLCGCSGFARIDFFIAQNKVYPNEINTLPGFNDVSMYPMLMMDRGLSYSKLIEKIIELSY
jgi:D-alanine-D-alanine ligase